MNLRQAVCFMAVWMFFIANIAANAPESQLLFSLTSDNKARVGIINTSTHNLSLEITSKSGAMYFETSTKGGTNYFKLLDLSKMPDDEYVIRLKGLSQEITRRFVKNNGKVSLKIQLKPVFKIIDNEKLLIYYANSTQKRVNITFNQQNERIFETLDITDAVISITYSLKNLPRGSYTVNVITEDETFKYELTVK